MKIRASTISIHTNQYLDTVFVSCRIEIDWEMNGDSGFHNLGIWYLPRDEWIILLLSLRNTELRGWIELELPGEELLATY